MLLVVCIFCWNRDIPSINIITCYTQIDKKTKHVYSSIVGYRAKLELILKDDGLIVAKIPGSPVDIPVITLIRALGLETNDEITNAVSLVDQIQSELFSCGC